MTLNQRINKLLLQSQAVHLQAQARTEREVKRMYARANDRFAAIALKGNALSERSVTFAAMDKVMQELSDKVADRIERARVQSISAAIAGERAVVDRIREVSRKKKRVKEAEEKPAKLSVLGDPLDEMSFSFVFDRITPDVIAAMRSDSKGIELSTRIWDIDRMSLQQMKNYMAEYALTEESQSFVYQFVKGFLTLPDVDMRKKIWKEYFKENPPGRGVYRSAWKNAMRVIRTETNNAFRKAQAEFGKKEPWVKGVRWVLSGAHPADDECDGYASADEYGLGAGVYPADALPDSHPQCLCHLEYVVDYEGLGLPAELGEEPA